MSIPSSSSHLLDLFEGYFVSRISSFVRAMVAGESDFVGSVVLDTGRRSSDLTLTKFDVTT